MAALAGNSIRRDDHLRGARSKPELKAARAVGVAVGDNPFSIIVPCHRVIGKDKSLTGYGGGFDVKKYLLAHELGTDIENLPFSDCSRRTVG
ncbi:MAG: methylated-DNA--[protein]-cysteine S-methyltransferase [Parasutterella excrementihominis]